MDPAPEAPGRPTTTTRARVLHLLRVLGVEPGLSEGVLRELRVLVTTRVAETLAPRRTALSVMNGELQASRAAVSRLEAELPRIEARRATGPFTADTTVHAAWLRHPGVAAAFHRRGLFRCLDCAVGADETLGEAALNEDFPGDTLLDELNRLLSDAGEARGIERG